jgi:hypothetical protein
MTDNKSKMSKKLLDALLGGEIAAVKPASLKLHRTGKNAFKVTVNDDKGEELLQCLAFDLGIGETMDMHNVDRVFDLKVSAV